MPDINNIIITLYITLNYYLRRVVWDTGKQITVFWIDTIERVATRSYGTAVEFHPSTAGGSW